MHTLEKKLKRKIMRRVYMLYVSRKLREPVTLEFASLCLLTGVSFFFISLNQVLTNVSYVEGLPKLSEYFWSAFSHTELAVKVIVIGVVLVSGLLMRRVLGEMMRLSRKVWNLRHAA